MFFQNFGHYETKPSLFINREPDQRWLRENIEATLRKRDEIVGRAICVHGPKGSGKTAFARKVLSDLRTQRADRSIFLEVDCRRKASARAVFNAVAQDLVEELLRLQSARVPVREALVSAARVLLALTRFSGGVELKVAHEHVTQFKLTGGAEAGTPMKLQVPLKLNALFGISLERSDKEVKTLTGTVTFDEAGLCEALKELLRDVRRADLDVVLFLDNIDELHHDYKDETTRALVWRQAEWALELGSAPVVTLACMRSYYTGVARAWEMRALKPLPDHYRLGMIERRLKEEPKDLQKRCEAPAVKAMMNHVARATTTPLATLQWFKNYAEEEAYERAAQRAVVKDFVRGSYANVPFDVIEKLVREFDDPEQEVDRDLILAACGNNATVFAALQDREVILPNDFWSPLRFTLDPTLHILHPKND